MSHEFLAGLPILIVSFIFLHGAVIALVLAIHASCFNGKDVSRLAQISVGWFVIGLLGLFAWILLVVGIHA